MLKLGFDGEEAGTRFAWKIVASVVLLYAAAFALYYPKTPINIDESAYLNQAVLMSRGQVGVYKIDAASGRVALHRASDYPIGTAAVMVVQWLLARPVT